MVIEFVKENLNLIIMVKTNQFEKEVVEDVLESYADSQLNLASKSAREELSEKIMEALEQEWKRRVK